MRPMPCRLLGDIAARHEPPERDQAELHYRQALALAEELGMRPLQAHCHLGIGTLYAKSGRHNDAGTELHTAIDPVPRHGHDVLAASGRGGAGAGGGAVMDFDAVLARSVNSSSGKGGSRIGR